MNEVWTNSSDDPRTFLNNFIISPSLLKNNNLIIYSQPSTFDHLINHTEHSILNTTSTNSEEDVRPLFINVIIIIICSFIIVGTLFGNILVCLAVAITRKLRTPSNSLIVSLAFSDLLISITVMPFALVYEVTKGWIFGQVACDIWTSLDVLFCTSSILNLCAISIDRYLVITRPFTYALKRTPLRMAGMIVCVWVASAIISIPPQFGWRKKITEGQCVISEELGYQLFATVGAFYLPLVVMVTIYTRIFLVSSRLSKTTSYNRHSSLVSTGGTLSTMEQTNCQVIEKDRRVSSPCFEPAFEINNKVGKRRKSSSVLLFERIIKKNPSCANHKQVHVCTNSAIVKDGHLSVQCPENRSSGQSNLGLSQGSLSSCRKKDPNRSMSQLFSKINHKLKFSGIKSPKVNTERKATRTLGVIMGTFIACWLPFFILALVKPFLGELSDRIPRWLDLVFLWLGYANSFLNPIIYARFNRDFRVPFRLILQCKCRSINTQMRVSEFAEQYGKNQAPSSRTVSSNNEKLKDLKNYKAEVKQQYNKKFVKKFTTKQQQQLSITDNEECISFLHNKNDIVEPVTTSSTRKLTPSTFKPLFNNLKNYLTPGKKKFATNKDTSAETSSIHDSFVVSPSNAIPRTNSFFQPITEVSVENSFETNVDKSDQNILSPNQEDILKTSYQSLQSLNNDNSRSNITSKHRYKQKQFRKPTLSHQHKLFSPKPCHAPVVDMSMIIDDDDDEDEDEDEDDIYARKQENKENKNGEKIFEKNFHNTVVDKAQDQPLLKKISQKENVKKSDNVSPFKDLLMHKNDTKLHKTHKNENNSPFKEIGIKNDDILKKASSDVRLEIKLPYSNVHCENKINSFENCQISEITKNFNEIDKQNVDASKGESDRLKPVSAERFPREGSDNSSILKVFNASFNEINQEDNFIF